MTDHVSQTTSLGAEVTQPLDETRVGDSVSRASDSFGISVEDYLLPTRGRVQMVDEQGRLRPVEEQGIAPGHEYPLPDGCLLYTSPSPRDAHESRMPSSA